jgi:hypothetical protein
MKLLLIAPCDRVLSDPTFGNSLIAVFHEILIKLPPGTEVPSNAMVPRDWTIFSKYELEPSEENKDYSAVTKIFWPNGDLFAELGIAAAKPTKNGMAFAIRLQGAPLGQNGRYLIQQTIRIDGDDGFVCGPVESYMSLSVTYDLPPIPSSPLGEDKPG